jgi:hypothetical protein
MRGSSHKQVRKLPEEHQALEMQGMRIRGTLNGICFCSNQNYA